MRSLGESPQICAANQHLTRFDFLAANPSAAGRGSNQQEIPWFFPVKSTQAPLQSGVESDTIASHIYE